MAQPEADPAHPGPATPRRILDPFYPIAAGLLVLAVVGAAVLAF